MVEAIETGGSRVGVVEAYHYEGDWVEITGATVEESYRGQRLYHALLLRLLDEVQHDGKRGLLSYKSGRFGEEATKSWLSLSKLMPNRVKKHKGNYYLA